MLINSLRVILVNIVLLISVGQSKAYSIFSDLVLDQSIEFCSELNDHDISYQIFLAAYVEWSELKQIGEISTDTLSLIDFSKPSNKKRFYLIDLHNKKVIYEDYVAHGRNSGSVYAKKFSNKPNSYMSSLGFYKTAETYYGKHGLSMRLDGINKGVNDNARRRNIVIHPAEYVNHNYIQKHGRLGRSFGCPALPKENYDQIIKSIKPGTLLFIYHPNYLQVCAKTV